MSISTSLSNFNAGQWTPLLDGRDDLEKYQAACRALENFIPVPQGGVFRRPGTEYLGTAKYSDRTFLPIGFNFSTTTRFVIEFGDQYARFWTGEGTRVEDPSNPGNPLEVSHPFLASELQQVQYIQINDVMYFVHPDHAPWKLTRVANDNWTFAEVVWVWPPLLDENITTTTITPSATTGNITLTVTGSGFAFDPAMVGGYMQIAHVREDPSVQQDLTAASGTTSALDVFSGWQLTTGGNWAGVLKVQRSLDGGTTWETIRTYNNATAGMRNISASGVESQPSQLRINWTRSAAGSVSPYAVLQCDDNLFYGFVKITQQNSATSANATVISKLGGTTATTHWSEGAFSNYRGFPITVELYETRLYFFATSYRPQSIWGSVIDDFQNFRTGTQDDSGLFFTLSATKSNPIKWATAQDVLLIGTAGEEWTLQSSDQNSTITPSNIQAKKQSSYGSKSLRALVANDVILFVQRQGRKVRELVYSFQQNNYVAADLTLLSENITMGKIQQVAFQQQQDSILWCTTGDGFLIGMTYERDQNVIGWHQHSTDGAFEGVTTIYGQNDGPDDVWFSVQRTVNGQPVRFIERFNVGWRETLEAEDKPNWWYVDCGVSASSGTGITSIPVPHLDGKTVSILADGSVEPDAVVSGGAATFNNSSTFVIAGLPYTSLLQPMKLETQLRDGASGGRHKEVKELTVSIYKSLGGQFATAPAEGYDTQWWAIKYRNMSDPLGNSSPPYTGDINLYTGGQSELNGDVSIRQIQPIPLTLLQLVCVWNVDVR